MPTSRTCTLRKSLSSLRGHLEKKLKEAGDLLKLDIPEEQIDIGKQIDDVYDLKCGLKTSHDRFQTKFDEWSIIVQDIEIDGDEVAFRRGPLFLPRFGGLVRARSH